MHNSELIGSAIILVISALLFAGLLRYDVTKQRQQKAVDTTLQSTNRLQSTTSC